MTVAITVQTPSDRGARVIERRADGSETATDVPAGTVQNVYVADGVAVTVSEIEVFDDEARNDEPQLDSGGGGRGDPDKPGGR